MAGVFGRQSPREDKIMNRNSDVISDDVRGKKVNDRSGDDKNRKKKGGCLKGIITCGVSLLIVVVVLVGGGLLIGNGYLKQNYGFGIGDAFAILKGLKTDGSKIVEQLPSENEQAVTDMCDELGGALMLKDGTFTADDISAIVSSASGGSESSGGSETEEGAVTSAIRREEGVSGGEMDGGNADESGETENQQSIGDMLLSKLKYDNVDENKLAGIDDKFGEGADFDATFSVTITPQAISAIAYGAIEDKLTELLSAGNASGSILDGAKVEQVFVKVPEGATDPRVTITLSLPVKANVGTAMSGAGMPSFLVSVAQAFLPEKMYLTCYVDLIIAGEGEERTYDFSTDVVINSMNDEQRQSTYKVIGGVLKMTSGETVDPKEYLNDIVKNYVSEPIRKADEMLDIKATCTTGYELEVFQIIADQAFAGKDETIYNAESVAALYTGILDGKLRDMKAKNESGLFRSEETGKADESQKAFVDEFCKKYLIASEFWKETDSEGNVKVYLKESGVPATAEKITLNFDDVLVLMGMKATDETAVQVNGIEVQSLVDTSKIGEKVGETNIRFVDTAPENLRLNLTEQMLGAVLENKVNSSIVGDLKKYDLKLEFVRLPKNDTLKLGFSAKKDVITENAAKLKDLFAEDRIGIVVVVPLAKNEAGEFTESVKVYYSSVEDCNRAEMISKILMDYLAADDLRNIQTEIGTALNEVENKLGTNSLSLNKGTASMASLFDVLATEIFKDETEPDKKLSAGQLQEVMQGLYTPLTVDETGKYVTAKNDSASFACLYGFLAEDADGYKFFNPYNETGEHNNETEKVDRWNENWETLKGSGSGLSKLSTVVGYYHGYGDDGSGTGACNGDKYIYITFEYDIHSSLGSGKSDMSFGANKIYATFVVDESSDPLNANGISYYNTKLVINDTSDYVNLQKLIKANDDTIDLDRLAMEVGAMMYRYHNNATIMKTIELGYAG